MKLRETSPDSDFARLIRRVAELGERLFPAMEHIARLEEENGSLREENRQLREDNERLKQQLAAARKDSSTSSKPPSSDIVKYCGNAKAIRFVVIDRHITQGTRSEKGRRWCERIWTVIATCAQQGRAVFQFLLDSVQSHLCGTSPPSLLPSGP